MISERHIKIEKSARFCVLEPIGETKAILFAMHGYRQLAPYFIKSFQVLADRGVKVIAPEGLHRFYIEGYSGRVGASWMTKEDRESDISDYVAYLSSLYNALSNEIAELPVHLLGFSQGGPTACRWLASSDIDFKSLTLYATVFPNDFDFEIHKYRLTNMNLAIAFGDTDQFANEQTIAEKMRWLKSKGLEPDMQRFQGGHVILPEVLEQLWNNVNPD